MYLVVFVLLVLGWLFWVMIVYSNRIAQTGPLGIQITDALNEAHKQRVEKELTEKWQSGQYYSDVVNDQHWMDAHPVPPVPDNLKDDWACTEARSQLLQSGQVGTLPPGLAKADDSGELYRMRTEYLTTLRALAEDTFAPEAKRRFANERDQKLLAPTKGIIKYFDFPSVSGQGPEFVLRFTALVTIIFAVMALSILKQLTPDQAGTILAAIAGYVLGQASSSRRERVGGEGSTKTEPSIAPSKGQ